jgi:hypothetical protein
MLPVVKIQNGGIFLNGGRIQDGVTLQQIKIT